MERGYSQNLVIEALWACDWNMQLAEEYILDELKARGQSNLPMNNTPIVRPPAFAQRPSLPLPRPGLTEPKSSLELLPPKPQSESSTQPSAIPKPAEEKPAEVKLPESRPAPLLPGPRAFGGFAKRPVPGFGLSNNANANAQVTDAEIASQFEKPKLPAVDNIPEVKLAVVPAPIPKEEPAMKAPEVKPNIVQEVKPDNVPAPISSVPAQEEAPKVSEEVLKNIIPESKPIGPAPNKYILSPSTSVAVPEASEVTSPSSVKTESEVHIAPEIPVKASSPMSPATSVVPVVPIAPSVSVAPARPMFAPRGMFGGFARGMPRFGLNVDTAPVKPEAKSAEGMT